MACVRMGIRLGSSFAHRDTGGSSSFAQGVGGDDAWLNGFVITRRISASSIRAALVRAAPQQQLNSSIAVLTWRTTLSDGSIIRLLVALVTGRVDAHKDIDRCSVAKHQRPVILEEAVAQIKGK